jgi:hypothetical protein
MHVKYIAILIALVLLVLVIDLIRRQKMTFKYSVAWIGASVSVLFFAVFDRVLHRLSVMAGFELASNFVFFLVLVFFILLSLFLTIYINEQNNRSEKLAQSIAILEYKLKKVEEKS